MTATRPVWRTHYVALDMLMALRESQSRDLLRELLERRSSRRRRVAASTAAAILCVVAVIAVYVLILSRLAVPVGADSFGG
jgi:ferric-dicitrate binding protein FerR (iron transport regulator)